ncbi:MAG: hypothetical protein WD251_12435, partial [Saccharospirillum sp.]
MAAAVFPGLQPRKAATLPPVPGPERSLNRLPTAMHRILTQWASQLDAQMRDSNRAADQALRQLLAEVSIAPPFLRS